MTPTADLEREQGSSGFGLDFWLTWSEFASLDLPPEVAASFAPSQIFIDTFIWAALAAGSACAGAYSRLR